MDLKQSVVTLFPFTLFRHFHRSDFRKNPPAQYVLTLRKCKRIRILTQEVAMNGKSLETLYSVKEAARKLADWVVLILPLR